jgi:hypothetical protein
MIFVQPDDSFNNRSTKNLNESLQLSKQLIRLDEISYQSKYQAKLREGLGERLIQKAYEEVIDDNLGYYCAEYLYNANTELIAEIEQAIQSKGYFTIKMSGYNVVIITGESLGIILEHIKYIKKYNADVDRLNQASRVLRARVCEIENEFGDQARNLNEYSYLRKTVFKIEQTELISPAKKLNAELMAIYNLPKYKRKLRLIPEFRKEYLSKVRGFLNLPKSTFIMEYKAYITDRSFVFKNSSPLNNPNLYSRLLYNNQIGEIEVYLPDPKNPKLIGIKLLNEDCKFCYDKDEIPTNIVLGNEIFDFSIKEQVTFSFNRKNLDIVISNSSNPYFKVNLNAGEYNV